MEEIEPKPREQVRPIKPQKWTQAPQSLKRLILQLAESAHSKFISENGRRPNVADGIAIADRTYKLVIEKAGECLLPQRTIKQHIQNKLKKLNHRAILEKHREESKENKEVNGQKETDVFCDQSVKTKPANTGQNKGKTTLTRIIGIFLILLILITAAPVLTAASASDSSKTPARILSLAPAATEILFDIGLGHKIVGVTEYCSWPPEARSKNNIGDMMHVNMEVVVALKPDIVVISNMNEHLKTQIESLGFPVVTVYQDDFNQICDSMLRVGEACGAAENAKTRIEELRGLVSGISGRTEDAAGGTKRGVLVVVGRDTDDTSFSKIYVAGPLSFYNDLLNEAGGMNVFTRSAPYANISREGLLRLDPDIIIELVGGHGMTNLKTAEIREQWSKLANLRAVSDGNIAIIRGDFTMRAGPRYPLLLEAFAKVINEGVREIQE